MLFVVLHLGGSRYALDVRCIAEVLPLLTIQPVPGAPDGIAGVILYRGAPIPVVDLNQTIGGDHSGRHASMRLVVVNIAGDGGQARQIALITEGATGTIRLPLSD